MQTCQISVVLANIALIYIIASLYYLFATNNFGTPFKNAMKRFPELVKIKADAVLMRKKAFFMGLLLAIITVCLFRPFEQCIP